MQKNVIVKLILIHLKIISGRKFFNTNCISSNVFQVAFSSYISANNPLWWTFDNKIPNSDFFVIASIDE